MASMAGRSASEIRIPQRTLLIPPLPPDGRLQDSQRILRVVQQRIRGGHVILGRGFHLADCGALLVLPDGQQQVAPRLGVAAQTDQRRAELLVQLDEAAVLQHVVARREEEQLRLIFRQRVLVPALPVEDVPEARVRADDEEALFARDVLLLQVDGLARLAFGRGVVAELRVEVRQLVMRVSELRVDLDGALEFRDPGPKVAAADPVHARELRVRAGALRDRARSLRRTSAALHPGGRAQTARCRGRRSLRQASDRASAPRRPTPALSRAAPAGRRTRP